MNFHNFKIKIVMQGTNAAGSFRIKDLRIIALANSMGEYLKVDGHSDLVRDTRTGAILNNNKTAYLIEKEFKRHKNKEMKYELQQEINNLKCEMHEIKDMLKTLLDKNNGNISIINYQQVIP